MEATKVAPPERKTLGTNFVPSQYYITIEPDLSRLEFSGREIISARVEKPTNVIRLNAKGLVVSDAKVISGLDTFKAKILYNQKEETVELHLDEKVSGTVDVHIAFSGKHGDAMQGFYKSTYKANGAQANIVTTHFEPTSARAAFPCIDEPDFKARFNISMVVDTNLRTLSNMHIEDVTDVGGGKKLVRFHPTPVMSTYLVYMGVGDFESVSSEIRQDFKASVVATPGKLGYVQLPLEYTKKLIPFFEDYLGIQIPLKKMDLIAVPDFSAGAMENWGAITFRESAILVNNGSSIRIKHYVADVISHELAHQWFGNLVTMKWWDDTWLNEGFATFMGKKAVARTLPEFEADLLFRDSVISVALRADASRYARPVSKMVGLPKEIKAMFDSISYEKGASVLCMLEDLLGEDTFRKGLQGYLKMRQYGSATKESFFDAMNKAAIADGKSLPIARFMEAWISKPGYPVIEVSKTADGFKLKQSRFLLAGEEKGTWPVGLNYYTSSGNAKVIMDTEETEIKGASGWIKLNSGQKGLYRVMYPPEMLKELGEQIKSGKMGTVDTWGLLNDMLAFTKTGRMELDQYLNFVKDYCTDVKYPASSSVLEGLGWAFTATKGMKHNESVRDTILLFAVPLLGRLGWETSAGERATDTLLRGSVIGLLGNIGHQETVTKAHQLFADSSTGAMLDTNIVPPVYAIVARTGDERVFNIFIERYRSEADVERRLAALRALSMFENPELKKRAKEFSMSKEVRSQDSSLIPILITQLDPEGAWTLIKDNWHALKDYQGMISFLGGINKPELRDEIKRFFEGPEPPSTELKLVVERVLEQIDVNIAFTSRLRLRESLRG